MMDQTHIGYTGWQEPPKDVMPKVYRVSAGDAAATLGAVQPASTPGCAVIAASNYSRAANGSGLTWRAIPNLGDGGAMTALPQGRPSTSVKDDVRLDYDVDVPASGEADAFLYLVPTLDVSGGKGLSIGLSVDGRTVRTLHLNLIPDRPDWTKAVIDNVAVLTVPLGSLSSGRHRVSIWRLDDNVVIRALALGSPACAGRTLQ